MDSPIKAGYFGAQMEALKKQIVDVCHEMNRRQFVANHDGNVSVRISEDRYLVTPTSLAKRSVRESDILLIDSEGKVHEGNHKVFSEWKVHRVVYELCPDVNSVCHAHPPYATAFGLTGKQIEFPPIPEAIVSLGGPLITTESLSPSASHAEIKGTLMPAIQNCYAALIPGNGVFTVGDDPESAYLRMELTEQVARAQSLALQIGPVKPLPREWVKELLAKRPKLKPSWKQSEELPSPSPKAIEPAPSAAVSPEPEIVRQIIRNEIQKFLKA